MKSNNDSMYLHGKVMLSNVLNRFLPEFIGVTPAINLKMFFCKLNIILLLDELPPTNYSILHCRVKIGRIS
jgi:hypothetical protein